ncbi:MAG: hypothetical protein E6Q58_02965 [Niabella sp.]|nr:MAG: hypothetical protein E6Q58_02965 [Niabella sp.]
MFQITPKAVERVISLDRNKPVEGIRAEEVIRKYSLITGKWFGELSFDGVVYKSVKNGPLPL